MLQSSARVFPETPPAPKYSYDLSVNPEGYHLFLRFSFSPGLGLKQVVEILKKPEFQPILNSNVKSVEIQPLSDSTYQQKMWISSMGISSLFVSECQIEGDRITWKRTCQLKTDLGDSGKYMVFKNDEMNCREDAQIKLVYCEALIRGRLKDIKFLGLTIMSSNKVTMKAKQAAIENYAKLWQYANQKIPELKTSLETYKRKGYPEHIGAFISTGTESLGQTNHFHGNGTELF